MAGIFEENIDTSSIKIEIDNLSSENLWAIGWNWRLGQAEILKYSKETNDWNIYTTLSGHERFDSCFLWKNNLYYTNGNQINFININDDIKTVHIKSMEHRDWPRLVVFQDSIYIIGGRWRSCDTVEKWNVKTNEISQKQSMNIDRCWFGTAVLDKILYVIGGYNDKAKIELNQTECYEPEQNLWFTLASMNERRYAPGVVTDNRFIYAVGGRNSINYYSNTIERYDKELNKWTLLSSCLISPRCDFSCIFFNGYIFAAGGLIKTNHECVDDEINHSHLLNLNSVEKYDPTTTEWTFDSNLPKCYGKVFLIPNFI